MIHFGRLLLIFLFSLFSLFVISCSSSTSPVSNRLDPDEHTFANNDLKSARSVIAVYDAFIDPGSEIFTIEPATREVAYHAPLTAIYPDVLTISDYGFSPNFWADIQITHPLIGSGIDCFDPRVIACLPANPGVSMVYPELSVVMNNSVVIEPDGYTKLFDNPLILGDTNAYKVYFKNQPYRRWSSLGAVSSVERWDMDISGFGGPLQFQLVVDVSTNYPADSQPRVDNCREPFLIQAEQDMALPETGGSAEITVTISKWQGRTSIGDVQIECPDIFSGLINPGFISDGYAPFEYIYSGSISNELNAPAGVYNMLVSACDADSGMCSYQEFDITVTGELGS